MDKFITICLVVQQCLLPHQASKTYVVYTNYFSRTNIQSQSILVSLYMYCLKVSVFFSRTRRRAAYLCIKRVRVWSNYRIQGRTMDQSTDCRSFNIKLLQDKGLGPDVTPGFKDKTECITICMPGSSSIYIEIL